MDDNRENQCDDRNDNEEASLAAIRLAWEDVQAGRTIPAQDFLNELKRRYGIPDSWRRSQL